MEYTFFTETKLTPVASSSSAAGGNMPGPKFVICYICGRKYGTQSITIHEKTCLEKFRRDNDALPPNMRRTEPKRPQAMQGVLVEQTVIGVGQRSGGGVDLDKLNQEAMNSFQGTLVSCQNCGRNFMPDRLEVHQRACNKLGGNTFAKGGHKPGKPQYQVRLNKRPPGTLEAEAAARDAEFEATNKEQGAFVTCKMCGKAFMGHSLKIHQAQCMKKAGAHSMNSSGGGGARAAGGGGRPPSRAPPSGPSGFGGGGGGGGGPRNPRAGPSSNAGGYGNMAGRQAVSDPFGGGGGGGGGRPPPRGGRGGPAAGPSGFGSSRPRELAGGYANMSGRG